MRYRNIIYLQWMEWSNDMRKFNGVEDTESGMVALFGRDEVLSHNWTDRLNRSSRSPGELAWNTREFVDGLARRG